LGASACSQPLITNNKKRISAPNRDGFEFNMVNFPDVMSERDHYGVLK
jgi:hypothetical protein